MHHWYFTWFGIASYILGSPRAMVGRAVGCTYVYLCAMFSISYYTCEDVVLKPKKSIHVYLGYVSRQERQTRADMWRTCLLLARKAPSTSSTKRTCPSLPFPSCPLLFNTSLHPLSSVHLIFFLVFSYRFVHLFFDVPSKLPTFGAVKPTS